MTSPQSRALGLRQAAGLIDETIADVLAIVSALQSAVLDARSEALAAGGALRLESLAGVRACAQQTLAANAGLIAGAGYIAAVDVVRDAPRWLEWWLAGQNGAEALRVNLDPERPDFYDYTTAEFFEVPLQTGAASVAGPFVDIRGTNEYTVTVALPVRHDGEFLGVAAADLYIAGLERRMLPTLRALPCLAALANTANRVIVSTDGHCVPGTLLDPCAWEASQPCAIAPWHVVATAGPRSR